MKRRKIDLLIVLLVLLTAKTNRALIAKINGSNIATFTTCKEIQRLDLIIWDTPKAVDNYGNASFILKFHPDLFGKNCSHKYYLSYKRILEYKKTIQPRGYLTFEENDQGTDIKVLNNIFDSINDPLDRQYETMNFTLVNAETGNEVNELCHVMSTSESSTNFTFNGVGTPGVTIKNETTATTVKLLMNLPNCTDRPYFIDFYRVVYQIVGSEDVQNVTVPVERNTESTEYLLSNLTPFLNYSIKVAAIANDKQMGNFSEEKIIQTLESCPQISPEIHEESVTNQSFELKFNASTHPNGTLVYMRVNISDTIFNQTLTNGGAHLDGLYSYTKYSLTSSLCTKICCSPESKPLLIETDIGASGAPQNFQAHELPDSIDLVELQWKIPRIGGPNYTWEILLNNTEGNETHIERINKNGIKESNGIATFNYQLNCSWNQRYELQVRAIVFGKDEQIFYGNFSNSNEINGCKSNSKALYYVIVLLLGVIFIAVPLMMPLLKRICIAIKIKKDELIPVPRLPFPTNSDELYKSMENISDIHHDVEMMNLYETANNEERYPSNQEVNNASSPLLPNNGPLEEVTVIGPPDLVRSYETPGTSGCYDTNLVNQKCISVSYISSDNDDGDGDDDDDDGGKDSSLRDSNNSLTAEPNPNYCRIGPAGIETNYSKAYCRKS